VIRLYKHRSHTTSLDFFPDGSHLVSSAMTGKVIWLWDLRRGGQPKKITPPKIEGRKSAMQIHELFVGAQNQIIFNHIYLEKNRYHTPVRVYDTESEAITQFELLGTATISLFKKRTILRQTEHFEGLNRFIDFDGIEIEPKMELPKQVWINAISNDLQLCAYNSSANREELQIVNCLGHQIISTIAFKDHYRKNVEFSPSGSYLLVREINHVEVFNTSNGQRIGERLDITAVLPNSEHNDQIYCQFTPNEKYLIVYHGSHILIIDWQNNILKNSYDFEIGIIVTLKISDDGLTLAASGNKKEIVVIDLELV